LAYWKKKVAIMKPETNNLETLSFKERIMAAHARMKENKNIHIEDRCRINADRIINVPGMKNGALCTVKRINGHTVRVKVGNRKELYLVHIDYLKKIKEEK